MFNSTPDDLDMHVVYDVSHNIAKAGHALVSRNWSGHLTPPAPRLRSTWSMASLARCWSTERHFAVLHRFLKVPDNSVVHTRGQHVPSRRTTR